MNWREAMGNGWCLGRPNFMAPELCQLSVLIHDESAVHNALLRSSRSEPARWAAQQAQLEQFLQESSVLNYGFGVAWRGVVSWRAVPWRSVGVARRSVA